jgi:hypothetical protein
MLGGLKAAGLQASSRKLQAKYKGENLYLLAACSLWLIAGNVLSLHLICTNTRLKQ